MTCVIYSPRAASPGSGSDTDRFEDASSLPDSPLGSLPEHSAFESPDKASISNHSNSLPAESWMQPGGKRAFFNKSSASLTPDRSSRAATRTRCEDPHFMLNGVLKYVVHYKTFARFKSPDFGVR